MERKVVVVVSGNGTIGLKIVRKLSESYQVIVTYHNNNTALNQIILENPELDIECVKLNIKCSDDIKNLAANIKNKYGSIYGVINCAGNSATQLLIDLSEETWDNIIDTNLKGTFLTCKYFLPLMIGNESGRIINFSSLHGKNTPALKSAYGATKHGVIGLTQALSHEVAKHNITVNAICPGPVDSDYLESSWKKTAEMLGIDFEQIKNKKLGQIPMGRMCKPEDIADLVFFLVSDSARDITGTAIDINGGAIANE